MNKQNFVRMKLVYMIIGKYSYVYLKIFDKTKKVKKCENYKI